MRHRQAIHPKTAVRLPTQSPIRPQGIAPGAASEFNGFITKARNAPFRMHAFTPFNTRQRRNI